LVLSEEELRVRQEIDEDVNKMVEDKNIGVEHKDTFRMILALLRYGADKEKVKKVADFPSFEEQWANLDASGYFAKDGRIVLEHSRNKEEFAISIILMGAVARGFIKREVKRGKKG
jgi:hypothetical protein